MIKTKFYLEYYKTIKFNKQSSDCCLDFLTRYLQTFHLVQKPNEFILDSN